MSTYTKQRRLDKIQAVLKRSSNGDDTIMVYELYDVPNLSQAVKRAKQAGAHCVTFVPLAGSIQEADFEPLNPAVTSGIAIAYAGKQPTHDQLHRLVEWCKRDAQSLEDSTTVCVSERPVPFQDGLDAGRRGSVSVQRAGKEILRVNVDPSELP